MKSIRTAVLYLMLLLCSAPVHPQPPLSLSFCSTLGAVLGVARMREKRVMRRPIFGIPNTSLIQEQIKLMKYREMNNRRFWGKMIHEVMPWEEMS